MILETVVRDSQQGGVCVIDFMTRREGVSDLVRIVRGLRGRSPCARADRALRVRLRLALGIAAGRAALKLSPVPDRLVLDAGIPLRGENFRTVGEFEIAADEEVMFTLSWSPSYRAAPAAAARSPPRWRRPKCFGRIGRHVSSR